MTDQKDELARDAGVIPQNLAIQAMRDSGYRNTAYAVAELIDNAVQADASAVELICVEEAGTGEQRQRRRLTSIAVLDDGKGMTADLLRNALQFGNGSRLQDRTGIGRFGMGLPNSSIAQASRVDVWSWQNGPDNALRSFLDVDLISEGAMREVPEPVADPVPANWRSYAESIGNTGTLIVWSRLSTDRMTWKGARATLKNTGWLIGRIHRKFIANSSLSIRRVHILDDEVVETSYVPVNDPMYLVPAPHLPKPFCDEAMFVSLYDHPVEIEVNGQSYTVMTRYSVASAETVAQAQGDRGNTVYGRDADRNMGVSVLRAGRELMLDRSWTIRYDPRERWWGCEVEFPPALDEIFGVTNNKQAATLFTELAELDWTDLAEDDEASEKTVRDRLTEEGDPRGVLLHLSETIKDNLKQIRATIKAQAKGNRGGGKKRHVGEDPTDRANERWKQRDEERPLPDGDEQPTDDDISNLDEDLAEDGRTEDERRDIVARVKSGDLKVIFVDKELGSSGELFVVRPRGGVTEVVFNRSHPAFESIFDTVSMDEDLEAMSTVDLQRRLHTASNAVHLLFAAWARMEREDAGSARAFERVREAWGKLARDFLEPLEDMDI